MGDKTFKSVFIKETVNRLSRCEGHMRAIRRMVEEGKSCESLFVQLAAVRSAVNQISLTVYENHLDSCLAKNGKSSSKELKFISRLMLAGNLK